MSELSSFLQRAGLPIDASTSRLAGLTNVNHLVVVGDDRYVLRIPGEGTSEYINRVDEEVAARSAAVAGRQRRGDLLRSDDGLMVTRFVDGAATMNAERFTRPRRSRPRRRTPSGDCTPRRHRSRPTSRCSR